MKICKQIVMGIMLFMTMAMSQAEEQFEVEPFSQAELEQILAPIALYPDTVLSHILIAATYPLEVVQAERWTTKNPDYEGSDAVEAVDSEEWDPSVKALVAFPQVLKRLSENLEWTQKLGDAFLQDEEQLLASVQSLRQKAYEAGSLDKMDKVSVIHDDTSIVIEPREREVIYVPYYDTRSVYGSWHWSHYPPVYWHYPSHVTHFRHHHSPFYWGHRTHVSFGFFFSSFHWHNRHVVRIPYHHYRHRPHHYYDRHQIARHQHVRRWAHNPTHRRGVSYRSVSVSNRYKSNRPSRTEVRVHRNSNSSDNRRISGSDHRRSKVTENKGNRNTKIASPNRIKQELRDGKISVKERNSRPKDHSKPKQVRTTSKVKKDSGKVEVNKEKQRTTRQTKSQSSPPQQERRSSQSRKSQDRKSESSSRSRSSDTSSRSRSSRSSSSSRSSGNRSSKNSRSDRKRER